jgi:N-acetylmuramoyl-L-alanine amidase
VPAFESVGGRALAELVAEELREVPGLAPAVSGMRLPVLRETRMPAVLVTVGPLRPVTDATPDVAAAVLRALDQWILCTG